MTVPHPGGVPLTMTSLPDSEQLMPLLNQLLDTLKEDGMETVLEESESDIEDQPLQRSFSRKGMKQKQGSSYSLTKSHSLRSLDKLKLEKASLFTPPLQPSVETVEEKPTGGDAAVTMTIPTVAITEAPDIIGDSSTDSLNGSSSRYLLSPATSSQKKKDAAKKMIEKHTIENVKLETSLHEKEVSTIKQLLEETELKNKQAIDEAVEDMKRELSAAHEEEKEQIILSKYTLMVLL